MVLVLITHYVKDILFYNAYGDPSYITQCRILTSPPPNPTNNYFCYIVYVLPLKILQLAFQFIPPDFAVAFPFGRFVMSFQSINQLVYVYKSVMFLE